jgi:hypothetical protein
MAGWIVRLGRWGPHGIEDEVFPSRAEAVKEVQTLLGSMAEQPGGWHSCPESHAGGCKWARVRKNEWDTLGWDHAATDRWRHCTRGDRWHRERIYVRPAETNPQARRLAP